MHELICSCFDFFHNIELTVKFKMRRRVRTGFGSDIYSHCKINITINATTKIAEREHLQQEMSIANGKI